MIGLFFNPSGHSFPTPISDIFPQIYIYIYFGPYDRLDSYRPSRNLVVLLSLRNSGLCSSTESAASNASSIRAGELQSWYRTPEIKNLRWIYDRLIKSLTLWIQNICSYRIGRNRVKYNNTYNLDVSLFRLANMNWIFFFCGKNKETVLNSLYVMERRGIVPYLVNSLKNKCSRKLLDKTKQKSSSFSVLCAAIFMYL